MKTDFLPLVEGSLDQRHESAAAGKTSCEKTSRESSAAWLQLLRHSCIPQPWRVRLELRRIDK
ncbi:hypothetical protein E6C60_3524 [Paenibacillus algicola]|uniref:Uncharacterized protein n=1 Tax=Paenibacillus algicola TaxID=2565926 RepID=A0A4V1G4C7_9BACL|nr:hypothetical protein [Paenibacillus algicola]QCT04234.1 hypothetical protein E6C60_3524 [Paenibacillus algicola]